MNRKLNIIEATTMKNKIKKNLRFKFSISNFNEKHYIKRKKHTECTCLEINTIKKKKNVFSVILIQWSSAFSYSSFSLQDKIHIFQHKINTK
jgi:hypothetical protein